MGVCVLAGAHALTTDAGASDAWPRQIRADDDIVCLGTPSIDHLDAATVTLKSVYRLTTPLPESGDAVAWGVVTITAAPGRRSTDGVPTLVLQSPRVEAFSLAVADTRDANLTGDRLRAALAGSTISLRLSDALALLAETALPTPTAEMGGAPTAAASNPEDEEAEDTVRTTLAEREQLLVNAIPPASADVAAPRVANEACADESFGDPVVGRGLWICRLAGDSWERWSPEKGWVRAWPALPRPAGAPWDMRTDSLDTLRARAHALLSAMRRDPRAAEEARMRRFELSLRRSSQSLEHAEAVPSPAATSTHAEGNSP